MNPTLRRRLLDVLIAAGLCLLLLPASVSLVLESSSTPLRVGFLVGATTLVGAVALRREDAVWAFWISSAGMVVLTVLPSLPEGAPVVMVPLSLLFLVNVYTVVAETEHSAVPLLVAAAGLALVVVSTVVRLQGEMVWPVFAAFVPAVVFAVGLSWALGAYHRTRRRYVGSLEELARQAEALREQSVREGVVRERERIAREVHDVVAHSLAVVVTQSDAALMVMDQDPARARPMLEAIRQTGRDAMGEIRGALAVLKGGRLDSRPVQSLADLSMLVEGMQDKGLKVTFAVTGEPMEVEPDVARAAYRIGQESVTNALKHGGAQVNCAVHLEYLPEAVHLTVADDGPGFVTEAPHTGLGLVGMQERARQVGGRLDITSGPAGSTLVVRVPTR